MGVDVVEEKRRNSRREREVVSVVEMGAGCKGRG